jgi:GNAT superfamily N-acetyltransferase
MEYIIREIEEKDYLGTARLYKKLRTGWSKFMFPFYHKVREWAKLLSDDDVIKQVIKPKVWAKHSKFYVLEVNNSIKWFVYWTLSFSNHDVYEGLNYVWWELNHIYVDDSCRWKWFASKLKSKLFWYFEVNNVKVIEIWVNQDNPALKMYQKWWFESKYCYVTKEV